MPQVRLLKPRRHVDGRGWFSETFRASDFAGESATAFVQDNHALSHARGTLRGLHFQVPPRAQAKLIGCLKGAIFDVVVDLRRDSPTYGKWITAELTARNGHQLFVPIGFAHGYLTLEPNTEVFYKVSDYYAPECEGGLRYDDAELDIAWPLPPAELILSPRDAALTAMCDFVSPFAYDGTPLEPLGA